MARVSQPDPPPAPSIDALLQATPIEGEVKTRNDARDGEELWNFAGEAEAALKRANNDKALGLRMLKTPPPKPCMKWAKALHLCR